MLLDFFKLRKKEAEKDFRLSFKRDIHAHLIPGVDDGPGTMEEAIALIKGFESLGVRHLTASSHIYHEYYPNKKADLIDAFIELNAAVDKCNLNIEIDLAAEYFLDDHFMELLAKRELLPIAKEYLLVEIPFVAQPSNMYEYFFQIQLSGYIPILAHPERYIYLTNEDYEKLLNSGCQFQVNLLSFAGYYGRQIEKRAFKLLEKSWIHALGSDVHNEHQLQALISLLKNPKLALLQDRYLLNDFL